MGISIIMAMTRDRVIGEGGMIPWHIADDMRLFKAITTGGTVIMGKTTWLSLPEQFRPLPGRANIIVSTTLADQTGAKVCRSVDDAVREAKKNSNEIYCMGGGKLYASMLPMADMIYLSLVKRDYDGDTYFPEIDLSKWKEVDSKDYPDFVFKKYSRI